VKRRTKIFLILGQCPEVHLGFYNDTFASPGSPSVRFATSHVPSAPNHRLASTIYI
jgi:hypothetical protein